MVIKLGLKADRKESQLNVEEAYALWDITNVIYQGIDMIQIWIIYAHDLDLRKILQKNLQKLQKRSGVLEKKLKKYSINGPNRPRAEKMTVSTNSELLTDENIGKYLALFVQEKLELLFKAILLTYLLQFRIKLILERFFIYGIILPSDMTTSIKHNTGVSILMMQSLNCYLLKAYKIHCKSK